VEEASVRAFAGPQLASLLPERDGEGEAIATPQTPSTSATSVDRPSKLQSVLFIFSPLACPAQTRTRTTDLNQ
jgi:hypothetical protein